MNTNELMPQAINGMEQFHHRFENDPPDSPIDDALARIDMSRQDMPSRRPQREQQLMAVLLNEPSVGVRGDVAVRLFGPYAPEVMQAFYVAGAAGAAGAGRDKPLSLISRLKRLWSRRKS